MGVRKSLSLMSVKDYLAAELAASIKHEYVDGRVYARSDERNAHNLIAGNVLGSLHPRVRGGRCRPFDLDTKIRIRRPGLVRFYYPDVSIVCRSNPQDDVFQDQPVAIFEVLSRRTRRIDEGEKKDAYQTIPSLSVYVLLEQETAAAVVFRRTPQGFVREVYEGLDAVIPLGEIEAALPLAEVYDSVEFRPEPEEGDAA
jgi:Uma2 family endonuclease